MHKIYLECINMSIVFNTAPIFTYVFTKTHIVAPRNDKHKVFWLT